MEKWYGVIGDREEGKGNQLGHPADCNMTNDGANALTYDAENHLVNGANWAYAVDSAGLRVRKCTPNCSSPTSNTAYIFSGAKVIAEYDNGAAVSSPSREYVYIGGSLLAKFEGGATTYYHQDHLSNRLTTNSSGTTIAQLGHFPFGESWYESSGTSKLRFTSYERGNASGETGNDYAVMRSYINRYGRFSSVDAVGGSLGNPQSLNKYRYAMNDPVGLVDPLGLCEMDHFRSEDFAHLICNVGGGGMDDWSCTLDGVSVPCGMAFRAAGQGAAARCPDTVWFTPCFDVGGDGHPVQYCAFTTGAGYCDPNKLSDSAEHAAKAVHDQINPVSIAQDTEYCSEIYQIADGVFGFNTPRSGDMSTCQIHEEYIPPGTEFAADYHTHGGNLFGFFDSEHFSQLDDEGRPGGDIMLSNLRYLLFPSYVGSFLGTPGGRFQWYNPANETVTILQGTFPPPF